MIFLTIVSFKQRQILLQFRQIYEDGDGNGNTEGRRFGAKFVATVVFNF